MPEPVLVAIAAALAGKSVGTLYDLVKQKFARNKPATAALEAAAGTTPDSPQVQALAHHLAEAAATDPDFAATLHTWSPHTTTNQITGKVKGNVIQADTIQGNITFGK
jgi:hypothetical protein